jgi:shikimate dehydrogenase
LPLRYEAIDVAPHGLGAALDELVAVNAAGNVTVPHKAAVFARCAHRSALADRVGAVNTFWTERGELVGDNTDVGGFLDLLAQTAPNVDRARPAAVIGAGGSAAAVLVAFEQAGFVNVRVHARTASRAIALCERFTHAAPSASVEAAVRGAGLVVNATPLGIGGHGMPLDVALLDRDGVVLDLVYVRNDETPLVRAAQARGLVAASGLRMLLGQGARSFELWFGMAPDREAMLDSVAR